MSSPQMITMLGCLPFASDASFAMCSLLGYGLLPPGPSCGGRTTARAGRGRAIPSIRWIDDDVLRALRLIPGAAALLIDHPAIVDRHATWRHAAHDRADHGGG